MRLSFKLLLATLLSNVSAQAAQTILVNQPSPYYQFTRDDSTITLYVAGKKGGAQGAMTNSSMNTGMGYLYVNTDDTTTNYGLVVLDISTNKSLTPGTNERLAVNLVASGGSPIELEGAETLSSNYYPTACTSTSNCISDKKGAYYTAGTTLRVSFRITQLCAASTSTGLCNGSGSVVDTSGTSLSQALEVNFAVVSSTASIIGTDITNVTDTAKSDKRTSIGFTMTDLKPVMSCPAAGITSAYFPGDSQIYFYGGNFSASTGVPIHYFVVGAKDNSSSDADAVSFENGIGNNSIVHYAPYGTGTEEITGFNNTTDGTSSHQYAMMVQAQNRAGLVSLDADRCQYYPVMSMDVQGVLKESKCFIATAAYQNGRAAPVMMLRKFRDQILSKFRWGREFIKTYYHYSPALAEWAWDKPLVRSFALKLLAPVELAAWLTLKLSSAQEVVAAESSQPYIDRLKKTLPPETTAPSTESYTEREKKRLESETGNAAKANESYIDRLKNQLKEEDQSRVSADGYAEKERTKLPPEKDVESPIAAVKAGRDRKLGLGDQPDIKNAAGFKLGITPGIQVTVDGGNHTFQDVYGTGFQPELIFHYERQLFHSENFGSFGLGADFGVAFSGGNGLLAFNFNGSNVSRTSFGFYQFPFVAEGIYRFNLLRVLRPYAAAGAGTIGYVETRSDSKADKRGYTFVYQGSAGVSLLLDFFDSKTAREGYLNSDIQHTYLFVEYVYLASFKSSVSFKRAGLYSGFTFEF